jgi:hypothetical protein
MAALIERTSSSITSWPVLLARANAFFEADMG